MLAHVPQLQLIVRYQQWPMVPGTNIGALVLSDWKCSLRKSKKHTTWVITKNFQVIAFWNWSPCFQFANISEILSTVRDIVSTNNVKTFSFTFCHLNDVFLRIAVSFFKLNFQQTQPRCNNYIHILIISCILATMPAWRLCFRFQQRWKVSSFVEEKPDREMRTCLLPFVS